MKTTKRLLSIMLAVIMAIPVILSLPSAATNAEAPGEGIDLSGMTIARYLVNDEVNDEVGNTPLTMTGNVVWTEGSFESSGSAYFTDGNYLSANVASLFSSNSVASNGFSVSFYGKPVTGNSDQFGRFFEFNDKGLKNSFSWGGNPGQDNVSYVSMWAYENKIEVNNYNFDARNSRTTSTYYDSWHHYVATFENGKYCLYVDGVSAYQTDTTQMNTNLLNDLCSNGYLLLGQAGWPDDGYTGYIRDFRIYNRAFTADQATRVNAQYGIDAGDDAISEITENKKLAWDFSSGVNIQNDGSEYHRSTYGDAIMRMIHYGNNTYSYDYGGLRTQDGYVYIENIASYLDNDKDVHIKFKFDIGDRAGNADRGMFAIGSAYNGSSGENSFNDVVHMKNNGALTYRGAGSSENILTNGTPSIATSTNYIFDIYFDNTAKKLSIYRNGILIGEKTDSANLSVSDFNFLAIGVWNNTNYGNFTLKYVTISQPTDFDSAADVVDGVVDSGISTQGNISQSTGIKFTNGTDGAVKDNVLYPNATGAVDAQDYYTTYLNGTGDNAWRMRQKFVLPNSRFVYLYNGNASVIKIPVIMQINSGQASNITYYAVDYVASDHGDWELDGNWYQCSDWNNWNRSVSGNVNDTTILSYQSTHNHTDYTQSEQSGTKYNDYRYSNYVYYKGSIGSDEYTKNIPTPTFKISYDGYQKSTSCGNTSYAVHNNIVHTGMIPCNGKATVEVRALNYVTMATAINEINSQEFKTRFNQIQENSWQYTEDSLSRYYTAIMRVKNYNVSSYNYSNDTGLNKAGADMKSVVDYFNANKAPIKKTFGVTFKNAAGTVVNTRTITAGDGLGALPSNTATVYASANKHNTYSWSGINSGTVIRSSMEYTETVTPVACSFADDVHAATASHNGYTDQKCSVCSHVDETQRAYNPLSWTAYNSALSDYNSKVSGNLYTTSTVATCVSDSAAYIGLNNTDNTPQNTPQATLNTATAEINTAVGKLKTRANFAGLDSAYDTAQADFAALNASDYTTSTYNAANTFLSNAANFPYHARNAASRADTPADPDQSSINSEADLLAAALSGLENRADFTALDAAKQEWTDYLTDHSAEYTTSSKTALSNYINSTSEFPLENDADRADTGVSQNSAIAAEVTKYGNIDESDYLDPLADLTYFDAEFDKANTFLMNLNGKTAEYTAASVQDVIDAVTAAAKAEGANKSAQTIANANAAARADYGQAVQADADDFADDIRDAMAGLEKVAAVIPQEVDASAFEEAVAKINNIDPDAYDVESGDLDYARNAANAVISSDATQKEYNGATINVLNGNITQQNIDDATNAIANALTVSTKTYAVTKDDEGNTDFNISSKNGTYEGGSATYGTTLVCDSGDAETAWYLDIKTSSMHKELAFQGYGQRLQTKVLGTTKIKAVKKESSQKRVKILRQYDDVATTDKSPVQLVDYVASGGSFTLPAAPAMAFYSFDGYYIGETKYSAGASVTINDNTDIIAKYIASDAAACAVNATARANGEGFNDSVDYNTKISLKGGDNAYAWVEEADSTGTHFRPFHIGANVDFFASESTNLKAVTKAEFDAFNFTLPTVNLRKGGIIENGGKKTFNAQLVAADADIQEYGILIAAPYGSDPINMDNLLPSTVVIENSGKHDGKNGYQILRAKSTKLVGASQFTISVSNLPSEYIYRGYAIYKDAKGNLQNVYSEAMR